MESSRLKKLIRRYQRGTASPAERYIVDRWLESFQRDKEDHLTLAVNSYLAPFQKRVLNQIFADIPPKKRPHLWVRWAMAALVLCVVSLSLWFYVQQPRNETHEAQDEAFQTVSTGIRQVKRLVLPDSTVVYLNASTSMDVPTDFGKHERMVKLTGEAYFEVKRDTTKPFRVCTDGLEVNVLGTVFNVNAYEELDDIQVAVNAGKVQVSDTRRVLALLNAAEGLVYNRQTAQARQMRSSPADGDASWREGVSVLVDANFAMLAHIIHNYYGVQLQSMDTDVQETAYNFTVRATRTLDQTMEQLCEMLHRKYRKEGNQIIIY